MSAIHAPNHGTLFAAYHVATTATGTAIPILLQERALDAFP